MKRWIDIVVPTWRRREKLARCYDSIGSQTYPHWRFWPMEDNQRIFAFGIWNAFLKIWDDGDLFVYICDDVELDSHCLETAVGIFETVFPDTDGMVGFNQRNLENGGKAAMGMIGRKFAERFPNRQVFCPDYSRFCADAELGAFARSIVGRFRFGFGASLYHFHPCAIPKEKDATHEIVRESAAVVRDRETLLIRKKRNLIWGDSFELVRKN